jgi:AcrR family transcriptional regulator
MAKIEARSPRRTGPRALRADARRNRERLLAAAEKVFGQAGTLASLETVARRAGVGVGTLYRHFPTREALIEALVRDRLDALLALAEELLRATAPLQSLRTWLRESVRSSCAYRGLAGPIASAAGATCDSRLSGYCAKRQSATTALLDRAKQAGEIRAEVDPGDLSAMVNAIAWAAEHSPDASGTDRLLSLLIDGLRVPGAGR